MAFDSKLLTSPCRVCGSAANYPENNYGIGSAINCCRCGDFVIPFNTEFKSVPQFSEPKLQALASYVIRKLGQKGKITVVNENLFKEIDQRSLPSPAEA